MASAVADSNASAAVANSLEVIVVGAGSAGLLLAHVLKKAGITCTVFEADAAIDSRPRDWDFGIYWAHSPLKDCLPEEIIEKLPSIQVNDHTPSAEDVLPVYNGLTAEKLRDLPAPFNMRLIRRKFIRLLSEGINVQYGKRLKTVELPDDNLVTAVFEDGSRHTANLLIGAEGAHSKVREYLLGPEKAALTPAPVVASICLTKLSAELVEEFLKLHKRSTIIFHPLGYFSWWGLHNALDSPKPEEWKFMHMITYTQEEPIFLKGPAIIQDIKKRALSYGEPFKTFALAIPDDTPAWHNRLSSWFPKPWDNHNGRITLIGDAAHAMTFHRGQGLNNAISDVASFQALLQSKAPTTPAELATVVSAYEAELLPRATEAVTSSHQNTLLVHDWDKLSESPLFSSGVSQKVKKNDKAASADA